MVGAKIRGQRRVLPQARHQRGRPAGELIAERGRLAREACSAYSSMPLWRAGTACRGPVSILRHLGNALTGVRPQVHDFSTTTNHEKLATPNVMNARTREILVRHIARKGNP